MGGGRVKDPDPDRLTTFSDPVRSCFDPLSVIVQRGDKYCRINSLLGKLYVEI